MTSAARLGASLSLTILTCRGCLPGGQNTHGEGEHSSDAESTSESGARDSGTGDDGPDVCAGARAVSAREFAPEGDWVISSAEEASVLIGASSLEGGVVFRGTAISELPNFSCLERVDILWIQETHLLDLSAFSALREVTDNLQIVKNPNLSSFEGLRSLESVHWMSAVQNANLASPSGLPELTSVGDLFSVEFEPASSTLEGFPAVSGPTAMLKLGGSFTDLGPLAATDFASYSIGGPLVASLDGMPNRSQFATLQFSGGTYTDLTPLEHMERVGTLTLNDTHLTSLHGLEALRTVGDENGSGGIVIRDNANLSSIEALSKTEVNYGTLEIINSPELSTLDGLESFRAMKRLYIGACVGLTTLRPLLDGPLDELGSLRVTFNENIPACEVALLCEKTGAGTCDATGSSDRGSPLCR